MAIFTYLEEPESVSNQGAAFAYGRPGRCSASYQVTYGRTTDTMAAEDMGVAVKEILGSTAVDAGGYRLRRQLPLAHPTWNWLYAEDVTDFRGRGRGGLKASGRKLEAPPITTAFWQYARYYVSINFTSRPYAVLSDNNINVTTETAANFAGVNQTYTVATEWDRYTDYEPTSSPESVTATQGSMYFRDRSLAVFNVSYPVYNAMPRMFLKNSLVRFMWYQVPFSYISSTNSYIQAFRGYINQLDWYLWKAGELLYLDFRIKRYTPPAPALQLLGNPFDPPPPAGVVKSTYSTEKFVDIEFDFLQTNRTTSDNQYTPFNTNWIVKGHNLMPYWLDRKFHYATTYDIAAPFNEAKWLPSWLSVPFSLLFTNPDGNAAQTPTALGFVE